MSVDTRLFLNSGVSVSEICEVLKSRLKLEVKIKDILGVGDHTTLNFVAKKGSYKNRYISLHFNIELAGFRGTLLSMKLDGDDSLKVMNTIASVFGGFLNEADTTENFELVPGSLDKDDGLYFLRHHIINGGDPNDVEELKKTMVRWKKKIERSNKTLLT